jgi:hypothetical protein
MQLTIHDTRLGLRDSQTRIPFRYGAACMTGCPQAVLQITARVSGDNVPGFSGDCLPPLWFDKTPGKSFEQQIEEMLWAIQRSCEVFRERFRRPAGCFEGWRDASAEIHRQARGRQLPALLASFGVSLLERAAMDALARAAGLSFFQAAQQNLFGIRAAEIHPELGELSPRDWLPQSPRSSVFVRHTVGLGDPLTAADVTADAPQDGFPVALEDYVRRSGVRYFKIKVANRPHDDVARLQTIAAVVERHCGNDYRVTLDGNEQYSAAEQFESLIESIQAHPDLQTLWRNTLVVEQPLARNIALSESQADGIRRLCRSKPVIIDESDGELQSYAQALQVGYRGVSSKSCKGPIKSLLNAGLTWHRNRQQPQQPLMMTAEDLCTVGVVPVQADLCLAAALGIEHVERNGHHYHPGLTYLPEQERREALRCHGDLYAEQHGRIAPHIVDGRFQIASLQCPGFGFAALPQLDEWQSAEEFLKAGN